MTASPHVPPPGCPMHAGRALPTDGRPLAPSPTIAAWRDEGPATPLAYPDGHAGWIVTRHALARELLADPRFSQQPQRMPGPPVRPTGPEEIDSRARESLRVANLLGLDEPAHVRLRRIITKRFSVRAARARRDTIARIVREQLGRLRAQGSPADLTTHFAQPISARVHCEVLGVPPAHASRFAELFVGSAPPQVKFDFIREVVAFRRENPGGDSLSDMIEAGLSEEEVEGLAFILMSSGRDSVAYMIATSAVALLTHPDQLAKLRADTSLMPSAMEEFMRVGAMFVTLFPRTATQDLEIDGTTFRAGETVSVSPVGANRDERAFERPDEFDITRDAFGHLGFGHGLHGCVGQQVARTEITEALGQLIAEFPTLRLEYAEQLRPMPFAHPVATYEAGSVVVGWD